MPRALAISFVSLAILASLSCASAQRSTSAHGSEINVAWHVDTPRFTSRGDDVDDASARVGVRFGGAHTEDVDVVQSGGSCAALERVSGPERDICSRTAPERTISSIGCTADVYFDHIACAHVLRVPGAIEVWSVLVEWPSVDGPRPPPRIIQRRRVARVETPDASRVVVADRVEYRSVQVR